jgi:hypothetical protein
MMMKGFFQTKISQTGFLLAILFLIMASCAQKQEQVEEKGLKRLQVSENKRFLVTEDGKPFFWLGDTGWFLFFRLDRDEADKYLEDRKAKGFNVIQTMVMRDVTDVNAYGDSALVNRDVSHPLVTEGNAFEDSTQYDYWDHVDYVISKANEMGMYVALTPIWGSPIKRNGTVNRHQVEKYGKWLAERYKDNPGIIWFNGGDIKGSDSTELWNTLGNTLKRYNPNHLVTFHPYGRDQSSNWFHHEPWLDFNMFQSGHENYDQDKTAKNYGEDNWRYAQEDYNKTPVKPTLDTEPSYEGIPHGLKDPTLPRWNENDVRRYAYWSVFAGSFGHSYGHVSVYQFYKPGLPRFFNPGDDWDVAINAPGAQQLAHLKNLMLSRPFLERVPDQSLISEAGQGERYDRLLATRGENYVFVYSANGREIPVQLGKISGKEVKAWWYNPRNGESEQIGTFENSGSQTFDPPGEKETGNDWLLVLDNTASDFGNPGEILEFK